MNEFIRNLDVTFEIVSPIKDLDFVVSSSEVKQIEVVEPKVFHKEEQATFSFDLPLFRSEPAKPQPVKQEETRTLFELSNETKEIKVNEAVQFVPVTELTDNGIIRYSLEEYTEMENAFIDSKPTATVVEEVIPEELNITMKQIDVVENTSSTFENISPMDMTIQESMKLRTEERRKKLKDFNYKFHNNISKIDELEREPAYKRQGVDLSKSQLSSTNSRISVGTDSNDDLQLRSNNSFLHDNVD
jgi:cell division protein FtsZ